MTTTQCLVRYTDKFGDECCQLSEGKDQEAAHTEAMLFLKSPDSDWNGEEIYFEYHETAK